MKLMDSTIEKYEEIEERMDHTDPVGWLKRRIGSGNEPIGTILPLRAAVKRYLMEKGYSALDLENLLPKAEGVEGPMRMPLTPDQLAMYHAGVDEIKQPGVRLLLHSLPATGMKVSEACSLRPGDVSGSTLTVPGKIRKIPISQSLSVMFQEYIQEHQPSTWLFEGYRGQPMQPQAVRIYTRGLAAHPGLEGLSPDRLRATAAVFWLRSGKSLDEVARLLGHTSLQTTRRYLALAL